MDLRIAGGAPNSFHPDLQIQGMTKEAMACYNTILKLRPDDPALIAVASNNILVINGDKDIFDSKKKVKVLAGEGDSRKLTKSQKVRILFNRCLFSLHTNQLDQCRELGAKLRAAHPNSDLSVLAEVALLHREKKTGSGVQFLEGHLQRFPEARMRLHAILAQLLLSQGNVSAACNALRNIPAYTGHVGVALARAGGLYVVGSSDGSAFNLAVVRTEC